MTKEITKANILQEMQDKFRLREFAPSKFLFDETVVPVYEIEQHSQDWIAKEATVSITSAAAFTFFSVPINERWYLRSYTLIFGATGPHKASGMFIGRRDYPTIPLYLDLTKGQEVSYLTVLPHLAVLNQGDLLRVLIDTYVSTQDLTVHIDYRREEIR